jgi:hypothetical protein
MLWGETGIRFFALGTAASLFAACTMSAPAPASTPPLIWQNVSRIGIVCLVQSDTGIQTELQSDLCQRVRALVSEGAPAPVEILAQGDPALLAPGTVTLLIHGSVQTSDGQRLIAFTIRPFRVSSEQNSVLFAAAPRAAPLPPSATMAALDPLLAAALSETVPWLERPGSARPIPGSQ